MKREPWSIAHTFGYAVRILNSIFCRNEDRPEWTEEEQEMGENNKWLVAEQINSLCSNMMIEDAQDMLKMVQSVPTKRLCEELSCHFHHPDNYQRASYVDVSRDKCNICVHNKCKYNKKERTGNFFTSKDH